MPSEKLSYEVVEIGLGELDIVRSLNAEIFGEERIINRFDHRHLMILLARLPEGRPIGFKIGYAKTLQTYYSAKGGILEAYRRQGIATRLLEHMTERARDLGYQNLVFETLSRRFPGMVRLALKEGFEVTDAVYDESERDLRLVFQKNL